MELPQSGGAVAIDPSPLIVREKFENHEEPHEFCQHSVNKKLKNDGKRREVTKDKRPGQGPILSELPGQGIARFFPRTEEVRGSNPLTSTHRRPQCLLGFSVIRKGCRFSRSRRPKQAPGFAHV